MFAGWSTQLREGVSKIISKCWQLMWNFSRLLAVLSFVRFLASAARLPRDKWHKYVTARSVVQLRDCSLRLAVWWDIRPMVEAFVFLHYVHVVSVPLQKYVPFLFILCIFMAYNYMQIIICCKEPRQFYCLLFRLISLFTYCTRFIWNRSWSALLLTTYSRCAIGIN